MAKSEKPKVDRRAGRRIEAQVPVDVRTTAGRGQVQARTRDVSANGVFLYTDSRLAEGANVELVLILPPELTAGEKCWVCCHARILRVEQGAGTNFGVAAEIRRMDVLPEIPE